MLGKERARCFLFFSIATMAIFLSGRSVAHTETTSQSPTSKIEKRMLLRGHLVLQAGGYWRTNASPQFIHIDGLIGDQFTVGNGYHSNGLFGVGYYLDDKDYERFQMSYGLNWYYLPKTAIAGTVLQENLYPNLSYAYHVTHYPLYAVAKSTIVTPVSGSLVTVNVGIGPNFMTASNFGEHSNLTGSVVALPDHIFSGKTTTTFSVTAGAGLQWENFMNKAPVECGYQFYYLGQGGLTVVNSQVQNALKTGTLYANAVTCAVMIG